MINIEEHLGLVGRIAKKYANILEYDDAFQQGCVGLIKAKEYFKEDMGYQFSTYATRMIDGYILQYVRDKNCVIRVPRDLGDLNSKINRLMISGKTQEEICKELNITPQEFKEGRDCFGRTLPISGVNSENEDDCSFENMFGEEGIEENTLLSSRIKEALNELDDTLRNIVLLKVIYGYTQEQIAKKYNVTQVTVHRRLEKAYKILRNSLA